MRMGLRICGKVAGSARDHIRLAGHEAELFCLQLPD
jgi:hypothetical protein